MNGSDAKQRRTSPLNTPSDLGAETAKDISAALNLLLADMFALYMKTKNFHWHISGPHFRDYHLLLDAHAAQVHATTDATAERVRKIGARTLHSIGHISRLQRLSDNDEEYVAPLDMLAELRDDNLLFATLMREAHGLCEEHGDVTSTSFLVNWIDEAESRVWYLCEVTRPGEASLTR